MDSKCGILGEAGLQFFGRITASISHEIRNVLAVLNENAGLLKDVVLMAEKGIPLDPERLKSLAGSMGKQILRANGIVENMNRFAHAVDEKAKEIDLHETLSLLVALTQRFADMRGVTLEPVYAESQMLLRSSPFLLENLLWCFLDFAMEATGKGKGLKIGTEEDEIAFRIRFEGLDRLAERDAAAAFPSERETALLEALDADFSVEPGAQQIVITLPKRTYG
jgi:C4-dicarboxylate-specific signal transduction histidine kinase